MNRRRALMTLGANGLVLASARPVSAAGPGVADGLPPAIPIREALRIAEEYVEARKIETRGKHLAAAIYRPEADRPHWEVTWRSDRKVKGGWFAIHVRPDRTVEAYYGE